MKPARLLGLTLLFGAALEICGMAADSPPAMSYVQVDLSKYFNNDAISSDDDPLDGDADFTLMTIPAEQLPEGGSQVEWNGIKFLFPSKEDGKLNNIACFKQTLDLPQAACKKMHLLMTATQLAYTEDFKVLYADGSEETISLKVPRFQGTPGFAKKAVIKVTHAHGVNGDVDKRGAVNPGGSLYGLEIELDGVKVVKSLALPEQVQIHIFAITLEKNLEG